MSAMWMTYSPVARMLCAVSLNTLPLRPTLIASIGGFCETKVKALNGARLSTPEADRLVTQAIGRGTTIPVISR